MEKATSSEVVVVETLGNKDIICRIDSRSRWTRLNKIDTSSVIQILEMKRKKILNMTLRYPAN